MATRCVSPTSTSSTLSNITVQTEKQGDVRAMSSASPSFSTPPTSLDDEASVLSDIPKTEQPDEAFENTTIPQYSDDVAPTMSHALPQMSLNEGRRPARSSRKSVTTYNVQILAGTAIHTPTKYLEKHHKTVVHGSLGSIAKKDSATSAKKKAYRSKTGSADVDDPVEEQLATEAAQAARRRTSSRMTDLRKEALRRISGVGEAVTSTLLGGQALMHGTLRRSASDSHLNSSRASASTALLNRPHMARGNANGTEINQTQGSEEYSKPKSKTWLKHGLYVGQHRDFNPRLSESQNRVKKRNRKLHDDDVLPLPMFAADRLLNEDPHHVFRDFKLPFDTYHPLPRKVKVDGWVKLHKSMYSSSITVLR
jgi:palmitoyltransferase ZDHHC9/14/18